MNRRPRTAAVGAHLSASDIARLVLRGEDVAPGLREQVLRAAERVQRAVLRRNRHDAGADPEHDDRAAAGWRPTSWQTAGCVPWLYSPVAASLPTTLYQGSWSWFEGAVCPL